MFMGHCYEAIRECWGRGLMRCDGRRGMNDAVGRVLILHYLELRITKINATLVVLKLFPA